MFQLSLLRILFSALLMTFTTSCAAMFTGTSSDIGFQSIPPGATVLIDEEQQDVTPFTADVSKSISNVTFEHPDYEPVQVDLAREFQAGMLAMDILFTPGFGLSGIIVDGSTSAFYEMPTMVSYDFVQGLVVVGGSLPESDEQELLEGEASEEEALVSN